MYEDFLEISKRCPEKCPTTSEKYQRNDGNPRLHYVSLGKVYFSSGKSLAPTQKHLEKRTHEELNLGPNFDKIVEVWEMVK